MRFAAALVIALTFFASLAPAAELPTRSARPAAAANAKPRTCFIDGEKGVMLPGGDTCLRISGSVSAQVTGSLSH